MRPVFRCDAANRQRTTTGVARYPAPRTRALLDNSTYQNRTQVSVERSFSDAREAWQIELFIRVKCLSDEHWHFLCCLKNVSMKKNSQILRQPKKLSLGDLILAVSSCTKSSRETVATVADLLGSGRVRVEDHGRFLRAKVC
jgi:hypothetical protein